jgi:hypothetical protein
MVQTFKEKNYQIKFTFMKKFINKYRNRLSKGKSIIEDKIFQEVNILNQKEIIKRPRRSEIINYFLGLTEQKYYLEIGVRDSKKNFIKITCAYKFSVDPMLEFEENPVDFKMTSNDFFLLLKEGQIKQIVDVKFDVIFIDGLHISNQVEKDIINSLNYIKDDGFIILHDCNPPSEYHQRENYSFVNSPAGTFWNGTTRKAFYKYRHVHGLFLICFNSDWGVGVLSKKKLPLLNNINKVIQNEFYEFGMLECNRKSYLNLHQFEKWKKNLEK